MIPQRISSFTAAAVLCLCAHQAAAQITFGITQQNQVIMGGGLQIGGFIAPARTGVRLGVSTGTSQLIGVQNFSFQNGGRGVAPGLASASHRNMQSSANQFVKVAGRFDHDHNHRLDRKELTLVGNAVVAELRQRQGLKDHSSSVPAVGAGQSKSALSAEAMVESFVTRCLTFDTDADEALDAAETKRMAMALIRSLS